MEFIWGIALVAISWCVTIRVAEESKQPYSLKNYPFIVAGSFFVFGVVTGILGLLTGAFNPHWTVVLPTYGLLGMLLFSNRMGVDGESLWARLVKKVTTHVNSPRD